MSSPEAALPDAEQPQFCTYQPVPGEVVKAACPECGHSFALHIGVEHCPVCELAHLNAVAREQSVTFDQVVRGEKSINDFRAARGLPPCTNEAVTVHVDGIVLDKAEVRRIVEDEVRRIGRTSYLR